MISRFCSGAAIQKTSIIGSIFNFILLGNHFGVWTVSLFMFITKIVLLISGLVFFVHQQELACIYRYNFIRVLYLRHAHFLR